MPWRVGRRLLIGAGLACASGIVASLAAVGWILWPLPVGLTAPAAAPGVTIVDRQGVLLRSTRAADGSRTRWTPLAEMDPDLLAAFVAVEDRRFHQHGGVDAGAVARAALTNLRAGRVVSGASTITMQVARLLRGSDRTYVGKVSQALWALRLERHLTKQQILEQYLNRVHLGQGTIGVEAASKLYFDASARSLSLGQAATLAGMAHAPSSQNPLVAPALARGRRVVALNRMQRAGYASAVDAARARLEPIATRPVRGSFLAPHFTSRVLSWADTMPPPPGGTWRTSLDVDLQGALEAEVRQAVALLRNRGAGQAAAVVLDNETGEILAWVGSPDFWAESGGQTDMVLSARQPGSTLKPFLYGLAFDRGFTPATVLADVPRTYRTGTGPYKPRNYDRRFHGPVRAREALASSFNVPAVELADRVGAASFLQTLHRSGFASLSRPADHYGLGLALGNGDVTLLELANGYRALANGGLWRPARWTAVAPGEARLRQGAERRVMSARAAALVTDVLSDPAARVPGFGVETPFDFPFPAAVKTGTSRHFTDNWAIATTAGFTVAVWVGNFSGRPMEGVSGVSGAGPLLHRAVMLTSRRHRAGALRTPAQVGAVAAEICRVSGQRAGPSCPKAVEWFIPGRGPAHECDWHRGTEVVLPPEYAEWAAQRVAELGRGSADMGDVVVGMAGARTGTGSEVRASAGERAGSAAQSGSERPSEAADERASAGGPPRSEDAARTALGGHPASAPGIAAWRRLAGGSAGATAFRIVSPLDGDRYRVPPGVDARYATVALRAVGVAPDEVRWYVNGRRLGAPRWPLTPGVHTIRAVTVRGDSAAVRVEVAGGK